MPGNGDDETVGDILRRKRASIRQAALDPGSPSWDDIAGLTWAELTARSRRREVGYKTFRKLLSERRYDK